MAIEVGQTWEIYSDSENSWTRAVVTKVDGGTATLRYEGFLEFISADVTEMESEPDRFRLVPAINSSC